MVYRSNHVMTELGLSKYFVVLRFIFQTCTSLVVLRERERERGVSLAVFIMELLSILLFILKEIVANNYLL